MILRHTSSNAQQQFKLSVIDHILPSKHPAMVYALQKMQAYPRRGLLHVMCDPQKTIEGPEWR